MSLVNPREHTQKSQQTLPTHHQQHQQHQQQQQLQQQPTLKNMHEHAPRLHIEHRDRDTAKMTSRDSQLRTLLAEHRLQRQRIEATHDTDLAAQLSAALAHVTRLDKDFQTFREGASRKLAAALEENRQLKKRLSEIAERQTKPSEKMLSVERLKDAGVVRVERPKQRSLRPLRRVENVEREMEREEEKDKENVKEGRRSMRIARSFSKKLSTCF